MFCIQVLLPNNNKSGGDMRWKIKPDRDPRQTDLIAVLVLLLTIGTAYHIFTSEPPPPSQTAFIVPSQSVRW